MLVVLVSSLLAGCTAPPSSEPAPAPAPSPTLTQEQQDDESFHDVVTRYVDLDANSDTERDLAELLTGTVLDGEKSGLADARRTGIRKSGKDVVSGFQVTERGLDPAGLRYMTAQMCLDVSGTRISDSGGADITPQRDPRLSLQVKAVKAQDALWRISDIVRNEDVHACG
ncbi:hypothetical protein [Clavibacter zhangzhiyongii]|uniref:hypothetical protein n=1 Tax=Clavibacter zhangzhiyongii TaxID=2768071 RepID=UPI001FD4E88D|nr:hypothetical protein [Clavibacter zhangzhiyongii]